MNRTDLKPFGAVQVAIEGAQMSQAQAVAHLKLATHHNKLIIDVNKAVQSCLEAMAVLNNS